MYIKSMKKIVDLDPGWVFMKRICIWCGH